MKALKFVGFGLLGVGFVTLAVFVTMWLWNWLIPQLFHGPVLSFWQTAGLFILSKILLSGFSHCGPRHHGRLGHNGEPEWWKNYKDKCKDKYGDRCATEEKVSE